MKKFILFISLVIIYGAALAQTDIEPGTVPEDLVKISSMTASEDGLSSLYSVTGTYFLSADAIGSTSSSMTVQVEKPTDAATVHRAFLFSSAIPYSTVPDNCVSILGTNVVWDGQLSGYFYNCWADVTSIVASTLNSSSAGIIDIPISECNSSSIDGEALLVIFHDETATEKSIAIFWGGLAPTGDYFSVSLAEAIDPSDPEAIFDMGLGISYGFQPEGYLAVQYSIIDVDGVRLTSSAGGQDDGATSNGALITAGGIGDSNANPPDPYSFGDSPDYDDELYNLLPFIDAAKTSLTISTVNPSNNDNVFLAYFEISGEASVVTSCPNDIIVDNDPGECGAIVEYATPPGTQTAGLPSGSVFPVGVTTNVFIEPNCSFTITVVDNEIPEITCPEDIVINADPEINGATVLFDAPVISDNCGLGEMEAIEGFSALEIRNGKAYYFSDAIFEAADAFNDAVAMGGFVATVRNEVDNQFLVNELLSLTNNIHFVALIGINDADAEGVWEWHSGEPVVYTNWNLYEPNGGTGENYTEMQRSGGWNDVPGFYTYRYVLEKDALATEAVQTAGLPSGSVFPVGTTTNTFVVTDAAGNNNTCSFDVTVKFEKRPTLLTYTGDTEGQYSDEITLSALLEDVSDPLSPVAVEGKEIVFTLDGMEYTATTDASGNAFVTVMAAPAFCEGLTVKAEFKEDNTYLGSYASIDFTLIPEDADAEYTGTAIAATKNSFSEDFTVLLRAVVTDDEDGYPGDISKASARFIVDGKAESDFMPVMLLNEDDPTLGVIEYEWNSSLNGDNPALYEVKIEINGCYYDGMTAGYPLTVYQAMGDFITGGGHMIMTESAAGLYPPTPGSKLNFGFNVKFNKKGTNLQGKMNIIYRVFEGEELVKVYQIKSNATTSLGTNLVNKDELIAEFVSKANLTDVTDPEYPMELGGNLTLHVTMTDKGEPGDEDQIAFSLYNGDPNALWFSSNWTGVKTLEQVISGGNLVVHSGAALDDDDVVEVPKGKKSAGIGGNSFSAYPNPFTDRLFFEFMREESGNALLEIYDASGRKLTVLFNQPAEAGQSYRLEYNPVQPVSGMLLYRMVFDNEVINGKVVCRE